MWFYWQYYAMGIILIPGIILAIIAQSKISSAYKTFSQVMSKKGLTGAQVAQIILDGANITTAKIQAIPGKLTDNYNPKTDVVSLSKGVHDSTSIAAIGIAAHEVGHTIQHHTNYMPVQIRNVLIPVSNVMSKLLWPLLIIGIILNFTTLLGTAVMWTAIGIFGLSVLIQLVTLPVEKNASRRALKILESSDILNEEELRGAKKVLNAAALTYVAALLVSVLSFMRFFLAVAGNRNKK